MEETKEQRLDQLRKLFPPSAIQTFPLRRHAGEKPESRKETIRLSQAEFSDLCRRGETMQAPARHLIWYAWGTAVMDVLRQEEVIIRVQTDARSMPLCLRRSDTLGDIRRGEDALKPFRAEEEIWTAIFGRSFRPVLIPAPETESCKDGGLKLRYEFDGNLWQEGAVLRALSLFEGRLRALCAETETVSVIVPVYNGAKDLQRCLDCLRKQTWRKLEILVVDDGSTDATPEIAAKNAAEDGRVRLLRMEKNGQLFHARLAGLRSARGAYIMSVDADDTCSEDYVEQLMRAALETGADLVICDHILIDTAGAVPKSGTTKNLAVRAYLTATASAEKEFYEVSETELRIDQSLSVFWSKLYRRDLVEKALPWLEKETEPVIYYEDVMYASVFLRLAVNTVFTKYGTYYYSRSPSSVFRADFMKSLGKATGDQLEMIRFIRDFLEKSGADAELRAQFEAWRAMLWRLLEYRHWLYRLSRERKTDLKAGGSK